MKHRRHSLLDYLDGADQELIRDFFACFAAAEFDLKAMGYIRRGSEDAQADWDSFACSIRQRFRVDRPPPLAKSWRALTTNPPRKQVIRQGRLAWLDVPRSAGLSDAEYGLVLVRRVRNNLFHGAKFFLGGSNQPERDRELVEASLKILEFALSLSSRERPNA